MVFALAYPSLVYNCNNYILESFFFLYAYPFDVLFRLSGVTEFFCKIESKFLNSSVLAGGFVMGCAKKSWF